MLVLFKHVFDPLKSFLWSLFVAAPCEQCFILNAYCWLKNVGLGCMFWMSHGKGEMLECTAYNKPTIKFLGFRLMVFNATFNNISVISWPSVLFVEETGVPEENQWSLANHSQTLSHNVVSNTPVLHFYTMKIMLWCYRHLSVCRMVSMW